MDNDMTVLIMCFDLYKDVWEPFSYFFKKNWEDCEYPIVMATCGDEEGMEVAERVIPVGNMEWTARLHSALELIDTPYVLLMLEDLYIDKKVNSQEIKNCIKVMQADDNIGHVRLLPNIKYKKDYEKDMRFGEYIKGQAYRISTHPAIWKRSYLMELTRKAMSAWDFEYIGSKMCCSLPERILCSKKTMIHFTNSVWRSKWTAEGVRLCRRNNIKLDFDKRSCYTFKENIKIKFKTVVYHILGSELSSKIVLKMRNKV